MSQTPLDAWALSINGHYIDRDGAPIDQPYQCHDVWLSLLVDLLGIPVWEGWAPGYYGHTYEVWNQFPVVRPGLKAHFTKHWDHNIQAGDVVFWPVSARYPGTHVVVALGPVSPYDGTFLCVTQNPGPTVITRLSAEGAAGFLRPINQNINRIPGTDPVAPAPAPEEKDIPVEYISKDTNGLKTKQVIDARKAPQATYARFTESTTAMTNTDGDHILSPEIRIQGTPGTVVVARVVRYIWDGKKYSSEVYIMQDDIVINKHGLGYLAPSVSNRVPADGSRLGLKLFVSKGDSISVERFAVKGFRFKK